MIDYFPLFIAAALFLFTIVSIVQGKFNAVFFVGALLALGFYFSMRGHRKYQERFNKDDGIHSIFDQPRDNER